MTRKKRLEKLFNQLKKHTETVKNKELDTHIDRLVQIETRINQK